MKPGLLSVVMVSYNHGAYIRQAIDSVFAQSYPDWELIIVDDGSRDDSLSIAAEYAQRHPERVSILTHPGSGNRGTGASYMLGLGRVGGEFIGFLESDDAWSVSNAEEKITLLKRTGAGLAYSGFELIGDPETVKKRIERIRGFPRVPARVPFNGLPLFLTLNYILTFSTVVARSEAILGTRFAGREYDVCQDWFVLLQASLRHKFVFIPDKLVSWRQHKDSYWNSSFPRRSDLKTLKFEMKMRIMFTRELLAMNRKDPGAALAIIGLFAAGLFRRSLLLFASLFKAPKER